jgi:hypothetical protein
MKTETRHLTLEQLLAAAAGGQGLDGEAAAHLEACTECSSELGRWTAIAAGVRQVTAGVEPPPWSPLPPLTAAQKGPGWREQVREAVRASIAPRRRLVAAFTATALVAAAAVSYGVVALSGAAHAPGPKVSTAGSSGSARLVLLDSVQATTAQSYDATFSFRETTSYGPYGQAPTTVTLPVQIQAESAARVKTTVIGTVTGTPVDVVTISYDGTAYESTDGGGTFQTEPLSAVSQYGIENELQLLQSVGSVSEQGSGTADGVTVERYHALIDPAKIQKELTSLLPDVSGQARDVLSAVTISAATVDVTIDGSGRIITLNSDLTASVNGSALGLSGNPTVHETWSGHFFNYGASIVVQPPSTS